MITKLIPSFPYSYKLIRIMSVCVWIKGLNFGAETKRLPNKISKEIISVQPYMGKKCRPFNSRSKLKQPHHQKNIKYTSTFQLLIKHGISAILGLFSVLFTFT